MRIAACVILYHPDVELLLKNVSAFIDDVEILIVYRNSVEQIDFPKAYYHKLVFMGSGKNHYMAHALNECLAYCRRHRFDYLLTMDQDSVWEDFHGFVNKVGAYPSDDVVIFAPNVNHALPETEPYREVESTITSGSLHRVELALRSGGYKDYYQIYWVDGEFCHRARHTGYKILALPSCHLQQRFGGSDCKSDRVNRGFFCADYSPSTYYFMFRNMLFMRREWKENPSIKCIFYTLFLYLRSIILGEENKMAKLRSVFLGLRDGATMTLPKL